MARLKPGESYEQRRDRRRKSRRRLGRKQNRLELAGIGTGRHATVLAKLLAGKLPLRRQA